MQDSFRLAILVLLIHANATTLTITVARNADARADSCVFDGPCGSVTSSAPTLTVNNCCDGDIVGNGEVNFDDLFALMTSWGSFPTPPQLCLADVNGAGVVDFDGLVIVITAWGLCP